MNLYNIVIEASTCIYMTSDRGICVSMTVIEASMYLYDLVIETSMYHKSAQIHTMVGKINPKPPCSYANMLFS